MRIRKAAKANTSTSTGRSTIQARTTGTVTDTRARRLSRARGPGYFTDLELQDPSPR